MTNLTEKTCKPCEGGVKPLSPDEAATMLQQVTGWDISDDTNVISQTFRFKNYYKTMAFVNAVAWVAHAEDHHPDMEVGYNRCLINFSTHAIGGLSENDFICAAKIDALLKTDS
ncbi:MAG: 4a-hydroxytetrahydrobiopterin dehydratase [Ectothiorhodospiraceae bacterium]|nr:4a-hydroxytetrahydrobiopterin dehydratase [Ectothiorhodospiraceae bacterium]